MKFNRETWLGISALLWLIMGIWLLSLGMMWITQMGLGGEQGKVLSYFSSITGGKEQGTLLLIMLAFIVGFVKGRFVLGKSVKQLVARLSKIQGPISFSQVYGWRYAVLIGCMMFLGFMMRWLRVPLDIRGFIDVAVGSALVNGATLYVRAALNLRKQSKQ